MNIGELLLDKSRNLKVYFNQQYFTIIEYFSKPRVVSFVTIRNFQNAFSGRVPFWVNRFEEYELLLVVFFLPTFPFHFFMAAKFFLRFN